MFSNPLKTFPGYALRRASSAALADLARRLAEFDLRTTEASVLVLIAANQSVTQSAITRALDIASANLAPIVARLDERGLIKRRQIDGRSHGLGLSAAGRTLASKVLAEMNSHETQLMERIPPHLRAGFVEALGAIWSE